MYFPSGLFARNVATLMTGTIVAGIIGTLIIPILTRLYKPEDFGAFAQYTSLLSVLSVIVCGRYELAIVLPERDEDAANVWLLSIIFCFLISLLVLFTILFSGNKIADLLNTPILRYWLWFLPLSVVTNGIFRTLNYWSTRRRHFKRLAMRQVTQSGVTATTQLGIGASISDGNVFGLIVGSLLGQIVAIGSLARKIIKDDGRLIRSSVNRMDLIKYLKRYKKFPLFDVWSGLLNTASAMLPAFLLGHYFNSSIVGYYALGNQILSAPMTLVGNSIAQVFFPQATLAKRTGTLPNITYIIFDKLLVIGFIPIALLTVIAPDLFALVFGLRWYTAGEYVRWMSVWLLFVFISSPLSNVYTIMEKQKEGLIINILMFISRLSVLVIGGIKGDALFTIKLFGITGAILWIINCIYIQYLAGVSIKKIFMAISKQAIYCLPYILLPISIFIYTHNPVVFVAGGVSAIAINFLIQLYRMKYRVNIISI